MNNTRTYRGLTIVAFDLRNLNDDELRGIAYSVYDGDNHISARELLSTLKEAKIFSDEYLAAR